MKFLPSWLFKVNNGNTKTNLKISSKLTKNTPERQQWHGSDIFIVNFEQILDAVLCCLLWTLNK